MIRFALSIVLLTCALCSCTNNVPFVNNSPEFKSFEISYTNGWTSSFSFVVDSNKIYFSPQRQDLTKYGILPDTLFNEINATILKLQSDSSIKSKDGLCSDCAVLAIKVISNDDTLHIYQIDNVDALFYPLVKSLETFIDSGAHQTMESIIFLETRLTISPPPPKIEETKFKPPTINKQ